MAQVRGTVGRDGNGEGRLGAWFAAAIAALSLGACSASENTARPNGSVAMAATSAVPESVSGGTPGELASPPAAMGDPDGLPDFGPASACAVANGDIRAMRTRLRAIERGSEPTPPEAADLLADCGATARAIATSLEKGGRAIARGRAHDQAAAVAYFRRAITVDPSFTEARLSLAGARAKLGDVEGAFHQLEQVRAAGRAGQRAYSRAFYDGNLTTLRLTPRFWTWAGSPVPEMVATLPDASPVSLDSLGAALAFTPAPSIEPELIFAPFPIEGAHYRAIPPAMNAAAGLRVARPRSVSRSALTSPWLDHLDAIGATLLTRPSAFRFGTGEVVVALPLMYGETGMEEFAVVIAKGPESGPYDIVRVVASSGECGTPVAFTSRDRRVLGYFTSCDEGEDPSRFGRCILFAENGQVTSRCGNGASGAGAGRAAYGSDAYGDESFDEDGSYEDYGD